MLPLASALAAAEHRAIRAAAALQRRGPKLFDLQPAGRHAWLALARPAVMINCNAAIFEQSDGLVVVDTHSKPSAAAALVEQIRREVSPKPVRYLIQTHFHYDHTQGTAAYPRGTPVIGTGTTRELLTRLGAERTAASVEAMRRGVEAARRTLESARDEAERSHWRRYIAESEAFAGEMAAYRPVLPDITFPDAESGLILHDRIQDLHLTFRGRAHTASDIAVWSPQERLVATGDLLTGFLPGMGDGFPLDWPATLRSLGQLEFDQVLPGHGTAQQGKRQLLLQAAYIEELVEAVSKAKRSGATLAEAQAAITPATLRGLRGEFGRGVVEMEARFRLWAPGTSAEEAMARGVRSNVARVYELAG
jgi:glyoxylase-like metal-dependent hydrolase (beta-lactamase superfamily II)